MRGLGIRSAHLLRLASRECEPGLNQVATYDEVVILDKLVERGLLVCIMFDEKDEDGAVGIYKRTALGDLALRLHNADGMIGKVG